MNTSELAAHAATIATTTDSKRRLKSIVGGSVGNLVEWYDWYAYSAFSLYFAKAFFPSGDQTTQLLNTAAVFAVGFLMRPVGGWLLGLYADRHGRKAALMLSVAMMCGGSLMIAITPTFASIGIFAPMLLILARLVQGLSLGGEYGASATYLSEMSVRRHRGFYASFQYVTLIMGQLLALAVLILLQQVFLTTAQLEAWGWRIPFVIGALCALIAMYLRRNIEETDSFTHYGAHAAPRGHLIRKLLQHPRELAIVIGLTMGGSVAFYTYTTYMQKFLVNSVGMTKAEATAVNAASLFIYMLLHPLMGAISDRVGRRAMLMTFGILGMLCTYPILTGLGAVDTIYGAFGLIMIALTIVCCYTSISGVVKAELFPASVRTLGVGLPYGIAVSLFGGTAEYVALWFKQQGIESAFYWYVTACIGVSLLTHVLMRDTRTHSRIEDDTPPI